MAVRVDLASVNFGEKERLLATGFLLLRFDMIPALPRCG
jgi:hypothetical protein